jgi:DNA invertase Pin-like site-specific DNA recombinase
MAKTLSRVTGNDSIGYLRVSSAGQVKTDYDPEGISIPAQRVAVKKRAKELKSPYIRDFVEPGKSAKSIEQRPEFQDMIAYLRTNPNVKYVIVYALSRFARNRYDDAVMMVKLEKLGITLVSATEKNLDDTPAGKAMHGMIAVFNQYQSDASGEDIKYKMGQKVIAKGGTLGKARVGYKNVRDTSEGREIRTIAIDNDKDRADLVREAFELYATGDYTTDTLHSLMLDKGLSIRATPQSPEHPVSRSTFAGMLRDRYYIGEVPYKGQWYPGRHEPLISEALFETVQRVLDSHSGAGVRTRKHNHYLRGLFCCARCGHRMIMLRAKGNGGVYYYYYCHGTKLMGCTQPYVPMEDLEKELLNYYARVTLTEDFRQEVAARVDETLRDEQTSNTHLDKRLTKRLAELEAEEDRY